MSNEIKIHFDGSCQNNPCGQIGYGCAIVDGDEFHSLWDGDKAHSSNTNNVAEYRGLLLGLNWVKNNCSNEDYITIKGDSMLVIKQMTGKWRIKQGAYKDDAIKAREIVTFLKKVKNIKITFTWIPREQNQMADDLSNLYHGTE